MKKVVLTLFAIAFVIGAAGAQTQNIAVSANVSTQLYFVSAPSTLELGTLNLSTGTYTAGTVYIRSNLKSWKLKVSADNSELRQWDGSAYMTSGDPSTVPYTFSFNTASSVPAEKIVNQTLATTPSAATTASFSRKATGGSAGEAFSVRVDVPAEPSGSSWEAANYQVILYLTLSAT